MKLELVVAHYKEDLGWLREVPGDPTVIVYSKGDPEDSVSIISPDRKAHLLRLPNTGRESGTYLHHIVTRYRNLAPITAFLQGNPLDHCAHLFFLLESIQNAEASVVDSFFDLASSHTTDDRFGKPNHSQCEIPVGKLYEAAFGRPAPNEYRFGLGACFAVQRRLIHRKPRWWWARLQTIYQGMDERAGYAMERLWPRIFLDPMEPNG